jgi:hypothetical protein
MSTKPSSRWRIALDTRLMDDLERASLVAAIVKVAQQSPLLKTPEIAASVAGLEKKAATLRAYNEAMTADLKQLKADTTARDAARDATDVELVALKTLVARDAKSAGDVTAMGFTLLATASSRMRPDAPLVLQKVGRKRGRARVAVAGRVRGRFVAEVSPDPISTWAALPGTGKERTVSGYASGAKLWVRFAQVRYGLQSDWSTPLLVTID